MDFTTLTIQILKTIASVAGGYGMAIVLLTVVIRLIMWPLNNSQQKSMRKMQTLSPKLKELQERYKSDPPTMQKKMMEFYKEHSFNPFGGCFPLLIQMPIFIILYAALMSPQFIQVAGNSSFLFINRLDSTLKSHASVMKDGKFGVEKDDTFSAEKQVKIYLTDGSTKTVDLNNPKKAINIQGEIDPGKTLDLKISIDSIDMKFSELDKITKVDVEVQNNATKEVENIAFARKNNILAAEVPTVLVKTEFNYDVLILVLLFGLTMWLSQKIMTSTGKNMPMDSSQQAMQKQMGTFMPIMITGTFFFVPVPSGVLLYLIV
ncbi:MAG: YidC/Oxa1 family membrane protein insertase, partial [Candidatus Gastranaerophilaceae bacterium]